VHSLRALTQQLEEHGCIDTKATQPLKTTQSSTDARVASYSVEDARFTAIVVVVSTFLSDEDRRSIYAANTMLSHNLREPLDKWMRQRMLQTLRSMSSTGDVRSHRIAIGTGSTMLNQYEPWYFGVAFAFCFKFCTGMPDAPEWMPKPRHRRTGDAPRVDLEHWVKLMSRRIEQQLKRDWLLGFSMGSFLFMYKLNASRTVYSYGHFSAKELEEGAIAICHALEGKYRDVDGKVSLRRSIQF
jgi:hypothetical protein